MQQLSLQHLNMDLRYNKNALAELNDCTRGLNVVTFTTLLHLGPKSITSRTLLHLDPNVIPFRTLLLLGNLLHLVLQQATQTIEANFSLRTRNKSSEHETQLFSNMSTNLTKRNVSKTLLLMNPHDDEYRCR